MTNREFKNNYFGKVVYYCSPEKEENDPLLEKGLDGIVVGIDNGSSLLVSFRNWDKGHCGFASTQPPYGPASCYWINAQNIQSNPSKQTFVRKFLSFLNG